MTRDEVRPSQTIGWERIARIGNAEEHPDQLLASGGPLAVDLDDGVTELSFCPGYSQHTAAVLREIGLSDDDLGGLRTRGIVP